VSTLNLGILAHVDAGKTSLTERLLYAAGVIGEIGSVDDGSTQTDSLELERQRGITIKAAVVSFAIGDLTVNLIDTPGHPDFIAEVERVLNVLDGAVLVVSAVEGVQAQTRVLMRTLRRLRIPTLIFVNKIDRAGADDEAVLRAITQKLSPAVIAMGTVAGPGTRGARYAPYTAADSGFTERLADVLADHDDALLAAYVGDETAVSYRRLRRALAVQTRQARVHPVFSGSAITGAGVDALMAGIRELLPAAGGDACGPVSGTVFKVERGPAGEKIAYVRMFSGTARLRDRLRYGGDGGGKVTAIGVFDRGAAVRRSSVAAGQIGKLWGLGDVRIGDAIGERRPAAPGGLWGLGDVRIGERRPAAPGGRGHFAPPTLETVVVPCRPADKGALHVALVQLAEQDPLINLRQDDIRNEISVSLYGEVQKEVVAATLASDFGVAVSFRESTTIHVERPAGTGAAAERIGAAGNPFLAAVGLRIEPGAAGSGVRYRVAGDRLGTMPVAFFTAVEETVHETLRQGLRGWQVTDAVVTLTHTGYYPRQSHAHARFDKSMSTTAGDFRNLTPLVLMSALRQAGTTVHEPVHRFAVEAPADALGPLLPLLTRLRATPRAPVPRGSSVLLEGEIPAARVHELERLLPGLTRGEGVLDYAFGRYRPVRGAAPDRPRTDQNPLDRKEYLLHVKRRV
jgi:ribosomal protection tetracycline resistance protein